MNKDDLESICKRIKELEDKIAKKDREELIDSVADETFHRIIKYLVNICYIDLAGDSILEIQTIIDEGFDELR